MFPAAVSVGVSALDFWQMTVGEITSVLRYAGEKAEAEQRGEMINSAFIAYYGGAFSRMDIKLPRSIKTAFPELFGRTSDGQIPVENWQEGYAAMENIKRQFEARQRRLSNVAGR